MSLRIAILCALLLTGIFSAAPVRGQDPGEEQAARYLERGDRLFRQESYEQALAPYRRAEAILEGDPVIEKRLGITLARVGEYTGALEYLEPLREENDTAGLYVDYYLGVAYQELEKYDSALARYRSCLEQVGTGTEPGDLEGLKERIAYAGFMKELAAEPAEVRIRRLDSSVNSKYKDYGARPLRRDSVLFFTSQRPAKGFPMDLIEGRNEDIYYSRQGQNGWHQAKPLDRFNTRGDEALLAVSQHDGVLYLYRDVNQGDIMQVEADAPLADPVPLPGNVNSPFHESSASVADSGRTLYFTSDRRDMTHHGGLDIYRATRDAAGHWQEVENLGAGVNSPFDENYVSFSDRDSMLYFSSNRPITVGGYDVMGCRMKPDGTFSPPENLGLPINTPAHDIHFYREGDRAWYATSGKGGAEDIYEMEYITPEYHEGWFREPVTGIRKIYATEQIDDLRFAYRSCEPEMTDSAWTHLAGVLKKAEGAVVKLTGHADWVGSARENTLLSFRRASRVAEKLMESGVSPGKIVVEARGEYELLTDTTFESVTRRREAQAYNRRVEFTVVKQGEPFIQVNRVAVPGETRKENKNKYPEAYAVMVYVSGTRNTDLSDNELIRESHSESDRLYYYHTDYCRTIPEADSLLNQLKNVYPNAYVFTPEEVSPRDKNQVL